MALNFARQRTAFGKKLIEHPLHQRTLARLDRELRAGFLFVMNVALLLGITIVNNWKLQLTVNYN